MPTINPVPSQDPSDLLFNAGKLDEVVNGGENTFTDRSGMVRRTLAGLSAEFPNAAANAAAAEEAAQIAQDEAVNAIAQASAADAARVAAEAARDAAGIASRSAGGRLQHYLNGVQCNPESPVFLRKVSVSRFEIFTPFVQSGRFLRWRFDNDESQFTGASPSDAAQGYVKPYLQTTVADVFFEITQETTLDSAAASSAVTDIGNYRYITGTGNYFEFTGIRASRLRCTAYMASNAGIFKVTINGSSTLVNLVSKDASGNALIDLYSASAAGASFMLADNLPDIDLTVRFEIVGKNASSTGDRLYLTDQANPAALRRYSPYTGVGNPTETIKETLKIGDSAVDYAIAFRPNSNAEASTPFIGSVHGYENRTALEVYLDSGAVTMSALADGTILSAVRSASIYQETDVYHPSELISRAAAASIGWTFTREGARQGTSWEWKYDAYVANGYTQMWTVYGANSGGAGGALLGWADRVMLRGNGVYPVVNGNSDEIGHTITDEVLFFGTPYSSAAPGRNAEAGKTACLVSLSDVDMSFLRFANQNAIADGVWIQDRATFRKMYLQPYRLFGLATTGTGFAGGMSVSFYKTPRMFEKIAKVIS